jgi:hypothetical protein
MNVYTYYTLLEGPPGLWGDHDQRQLIEVWKRSWQKQGWNPVVMDESWCQRHPRYKEFKEKFTTLPTEYGHQYESACFLRYVAMATIPGGGLLTDYDVMAYDFETRAPDPGVMRFYGKRDCLVNTGCCLAPRELYEGLCQLYFTWVPDQRDWNPNAKPPQYHCSDVSYIVQCWDGSREKPAWMQAKQNCPVWPNPGWETSPLVHYGYELRAAGHWPKWQHIEKLRPF